MKIYTRTGDSGDTALFGGGRVRKDHVRVEAYGSVDELNSVLGWAAVEVAVPEVRRRIVELQHDLFGVGAHLATPGGEGRKRPDLPPLPGDRIGEMEAWIDEAEGELEPLRSFVLPGGSRGAAALHTARSVCRRAERALASLASAEDVDPVIPGYLNRLSDLLFVWARLENHRSGVGDVHWEKPSR